MSVAVRVLFLVSFFGSAAPQVAFAHWEGFEAADPSTPAAVLRLESAADRYTLSGVTRLSWRALFAEEDPEEREAQSSDTHSDHEPVHDAPATLQQ